MSKKKQNRPKAKPAQKGPKKGGRKAAPKSSATPPGDVVAAGAESGDEAADDAAFEPAVPGPADGTPEAEEAAGDPAAEPVEIPLDIEDAPLQTDEPVDEPLAEVVSADPGTQLIATGELHAALEALLFTSPEPLSVTKLARALGDVPAKDVRDALTQLAAEYDEQGRGFRVVEVSGGFQMATRERFAEHILRLGSKKKQAALSGAMLETLAIIAYRQPVIRAVVESIRGVESSGVMRNLLDLELIDVVGRKEVIGRPQMYGTTEKFLRTFGLRGLEDLPSIRGLREKLEAEEAEAARLERLARDRAEAEAADDSGKNAEASGEAPADDGTEAGDAPPPIPFDDEEDAEAVDDELEDDSGDE